MPHNVSQKAQRAAGRAATPLPPEQEAKQSTEEASSSLPEQLG